MRLVNIGYGNVVVAERVVAVISPDSAPMKRFKDEARKAGRLIDGTQGRRTRSILITDSHHIVLSALQTETVGERLERGGHVQSPQAAVQHADARHAPEESAESPEVADGSEGGESPDRDAGEDAEPLQADSEDDGAGSEAEKDDKDPEEKDEEESSA